MKHILLSFLLLLSGCSSTVMLVQPVDYIDSSQIVFATAPPAPAPAPTAIYAPDATLPTLNFRGPQAKFEISGGGGTNSTYKAERSVRKLAVSMARIQRMAVVKNTATDSILDQLHAATIAFNVPESVNVADKFRIQVVIDPAKQVGEVTIAQKGTVISSKIQVSKIVTVKLIAPSFTVASLSSEEQAVADSAHTIWEWDVTPTKPGKQEVKITVDALVKVDDISANRHITTFDQSVFIDITKQQVIVGWLKQYGQWLWSTILLPIFVFIWKRYIAKKADE